MGNPENVQTFSMEEARLAPYSERRNAGKYLQKRSHLEEQ
jgi:hypothetical protein